MATYSHEHKLVFIHIPKNAGTSVNFWMKRYLNGEKKGITHGGIQHTSKEFNHYTSFAIVRNPWDRTLSFWSFLKSKIMRKLARAVDGSQEQQDLQLELALIKSGFENWVYEGGLEYPHKTNKKAWFTYGLNQVEWLPTNPNYILRYEKLGKQFKKIKNFTGVNQGLGKSNQSNHTNYRNYYNQQLTNHVGDLFAKDIERFNYDF